MSAFCEQAWRELSAVTARVDQAQVERACDMIVSAKAIMLYGCGREGLQMRGLAMRLHHLGKRVAMQGDMAAPPIGAGDLFIASAGPGELATVAALIGVARNAGAEILFITAEPAARSAQLADLILVVPAQTMASDQDPNKTSVLPMGSLFEGAMFVLFEQMVERVRQKLGITMQAMRANHTNME